MLSAVYEKPIDIDPARPFETILLSPEHDLSTRETPHIEDGLACVLSRIISGKSVRKNRRSAS
jgi:hypothetical protein